MILITQGEVGGKRREDGLGTETGGNGRMDGWKGETTLGRETVE